MTEHRNGGAAVVETLAAHGVDTIFGIPGTHNLEIYRHLPRTGIRAITPRHEQGAGYAAEAFARVTGRPGVVVTTSGPGLTNVMTAASTAYAESQPMLVLSSGLPTGAEGRDLGQLHEAKNPLGAMDQLVRWSRRVHSADEAAAAVTEAFGSFTGGRPRPVHIEVPFDVLEQSWSGDARAVHESRCTAGRSGCSPPGGRSAGRGRPADDHRRRRRRRRAGRSDRAGRGARRAGRHHGQRQGRGRRGTSTLSRCVDPAACPAESRRGQRRAAGGRHRVGRFRLVGRADSRPDGDPLRHRPGPAGQELPGRSRAAGRRRDDTRRAAAITT